MAYSIDGFDLKTTFGLEVESITDLYSTPARKTKKAVSQEWPNEHGEEPFLDPQDITFQARNINVKGFMIASSKADLETKLGDLFNLLSSEGLHTLSTSHSDTTFEVFLKDKITVTKMSQPSSTPVYARLAITLREPNPTLVLSNVPPVIGPRTGTITTKQYVSITAQNKDCQIKYTLDGSDPSAENGITYKDRFPLAADRTVKAVALDTDNKASSITSKAFVVKPPRPESTPKGNGVNDTGVKLYTPYNSNETDHSEYSNTLTAFNAPQLKTGTNEFKMGGGAYLLNGTSQYFQKDVAVVTAPPFTLSAWFRTSYKTQPQCIIGLCKSDVSATLAGLRVNVSGQIELLTFTGTSSFITSASTYDDDNWHHVVGVWKSTTDKSLFVDGVLVGTDTVYINIINYNRTFIGRWGDFSPTAYFNGYLDEAKIWNRELLLSEIKALYAGEDATFSSELVNQNITTATQISLSDSVFESQIYYTLDGSDPDDTDTLYTTAFTLTSGTKIVKAVAKHNGIYSDIMREVFIVT